MSNQPEEDSGSSAPRGPAVFIVAIVVLAVFSVFAVWMLANADGDEKIWARQVYVFGAVEAITFAAVGWLFGREVHRGQAEAAKKDADKAKDEAAANQEKAEAKAEEAAVARTKGATLAAAIRHNTIGPPPTRPRSAQPVGLDDDPEPAGPLTGLRGLADELFPPT